MRAFVALNLDIATTRALARHAKEMRASPNAPKASWVAPTNLHVTLKFLGDVDRALVPALSDALAPLAAATPPFAVSGVALAAFPRSSHARVLVYEIMMGDAERERATKLHADVDAAFAELGLPRDDRHWRPHVTFGRARQEIDARAFFEAEKERLEVPPEARVLEIVLYESVLAQAGAEYTALWRAPLRP